jgi:hypothetical protein
MNQSTDTLPMPYRSEAFAEDLFDEDSAPPWSMAQAGVAALLCALPVSLALVGGVATVFG